MWEGNERLTKRDLNTAIYDELKRIARRQETTTYSAIAPLANLDMDNPAHRNQMRELLGKISTYEHQKGRPLLTAIVVYRQENEPGPGFFDLARHLRLLRSGQDEVAFFCHEVARVHHEWSRDGER